MNSVAANPNTQLEQKKKRVAFVAPAIMTIPIILYTAIEPFIQPSFFIVNLFSFFEIIAFILFIIACLLKINDGKHKILILPSFAILTVCHFAYAIINIILVAQNNHILYAFAKSGDYYLPAFLLFSFSILSEIADKNTLRVITSIIGFIYIVSRIIVLSYVLGALLPCPIIEVIPSLSYNVFYCIFSLAIAIYQFMSLKKKQKPTVVVYQQVNYQPVRPVQPVYQRPVVPSAPQQSAEEKLLSLKKIFDSNAITQEEYDKKREEILKDF